MPSTNARVDKVETGAMWRDAFKARRCVIPASGFDEGQAKGSETPHYFSAPDGRPLAFADLWERSCHPETGEPLLSATIITGGSCEWMQTYHDRRPNILAWADVDAWLRVDNAASLLRPPLDNSLQEWIVSPRVNRSGVGDDDRNLIEPTVFA